MAGPPARKKVEEARRRHATERSDRSTSKPPPCSAPPPPSPETSFTELSSTNAVCDSTEYQDTETTKASARKPRNDTARVSSMDINKGIDEVADKTMTSLKDLSLRESGSQYGGTSHPTNDRPNANTGMKGQEAAQSEDGVNSSGRSYTGSSISCLSATNAGYGGGEPTDLAQQLTRGYRDLRAALGEEPEGKWLGNAGSDIPAAHATPGIQLYVVSRPWSSAIEPEVDRNEPEESAAATNDDWLTKTFFRLSTAPSSFFNPAGGIFTVSFSWAVNIIGQNQFEVDTLDLRKVLSVDSELRRRGFDAGLNSEILAWLVDSCGTESRDFDSSAFQ